MTYTNTPTWKEPTSAERAYSDAIERAAAFAAVAREEAKLCAKVVMMRMAARGIDYADGNASPQAAQSRLTDYLDDVIRDFFILPDPDRAADDAEYAGAPDGPEED